MIQLTSIRVSQILDHSLEVHLAEVVWALPALGLVEEDSDLPFLILLAEEVLVADSVALGSVEDSEAEEASVVADFIHECCDLVVC
jgi:hypothetical protein